MEKIMNDIAKELNAAKILIDRPKKWTQGAMARDVIGREVYEYAIRAVRFCSIGALKIIPNSVTFSTLQTILCEAHRRRDCSF
jgi:hypothetical protein